VFSRGKRTIFLHYPLKNDHSPHILGKDSVVRSQKLTPGVFVYWAKILFIDGKVGLYKGDVTIVK
jgi:hypothetical protein